MSFMISNRPCSRRQSARLKTEEPVGTNDLFEIENSKSTITSQCKETSILQTEVQKVEGERSVRALLYSTLYSIQKTN